MRSPKILGKIRTCLKLINATVQKHLIMFDLRAIVLDSNNASKKENEKDNSSVSSTNEKKIERDVSSIEDHLKWNAINSTNQSLCTKKGPKEKSTMMEASIPDFDEKPFYHSFNTPTGNEANVDHVLDEKIADK